MAMHASVEWDHGMTFTGTAGSGFQVPLGTVPEVGGEDDGFRPLELMLVSLAGCTAMDVISILTRKRQDVTGFHVDVRAERAREHPRVFTAITIEYVLRGRGLDAEAVKRAIGLSETRYCAAQAMLGKAVPITLTHRIEEETSAPAP
jgi:putative redox protein